MKRVGVTKSFDFGPMEFLNGFSFEFFIRQCRAALFTPTSNWYRISTLDVSVLQEKQSRSELPGASQEIKADVTRCESFGHNPHTTAYPRGASKHN